MSENGVRATAAHLQMRAHERYRDWRLGVDTCGVIPSSELGDDAACIDYEPVNYRCLDVAFNYLTVREGGDVFLDYGCGKGRALAYAATFPFRRIIGVDRVPELCAAAEENLRRVKPDIQCADIDIVAADAREFELPGDVSVIFMFNPFTGQILEDVQEKIRQSLARAPRKTTIIYLYPHNRQEDAFAGRPWITKVCELPTSSWSSIVTLVVYESAPGAGNGQAVAAV